MSVTHSSQAVLAFWTTIIERSYLDPILIHIGHFIWIPRCHSKQQNGTRCSHSATYRVAHKPTHCFLLRFYRGFSITADTDTHPWHISIIVQKCSSLCSSANDVNQQATERERAHRDGDVARHKRSRYISTKGLVPLMGLFCSDALISRHDMRSVSVRENLNNATYTKQDYSKSELQRDTQLKKHRIKQEIWKTKRFCFNKPFAKWKLTGFPFYPNN